MTRRIDLGSYVGVAKYATLDLDRLIESRALVQANSGGGKSWTIRRLLEQTHGLVQHLVIDVDGEYHTLREKFDYVIAARTGGDTLADVRTADLLAKRLLELGVSAILDIYELKAHDRILFVRRFLDSLVNAPKDLWHPALVVVDEAHHFCPQHGEAESASAVIDLMTRGRKRGFCGVLATQRISKLHKDAAAEANVKLIGRASLDVDMKRAADELGFTTREERDALRHLNAGEFYAFGPGLSDTVVKIHIGDVETSHPKIGQRAVPVPAPREKVKAILSKLADLPKEAEEEAKTASELRTKVRGLEADLRKAQAGQPQENVETIKKLRAEVASWKEVNDGTMRMLDNRWRIAKRLAELFAKTSQEVELTLAKLTCEPVAPPEANGRRYSPELLNREPARPKQIVVKHGHFDPIERAFSDMSQRVATELDREIADNLSRPQQRILDALAWFESIGIVRVKRNQVAFVAGTSPVSSAYANNVSNLHTRKLVDYPIDGHLSLSDGGRNVARAPEDAPTPESLQAAVLRKLTNKEADLLRVLLSHYPESLSREDLAEKAGVSPASSAYANNVSHLSSLELASYPEKGKVVASPLLFLEAATT